MEEYLDIIDENDEVIRQENRRVVHQSGLWHRGVHVFLFTPDRKLLIQERSKTQDTFPGALDCSVSEHIKAGESYLEGASRGLREELGIEEVKLKRLMHFKMTYGLNDNEYSELYEGEYIEESLTIDHNEVERIGFHTIPELEAMIVSEKSPLAYWFIQLIRWYAGKPADMQVFWSLRP